MTRFPTYPTDILSRADALLASKYGTSEPIDPVLVEVACEAMMAERARCVELARELYFEAVEYGNDGIEWSVKFKAEGWRNSQIAKAIRGTE